MLESAIRSEGSKHVSRVHAGTVIHILQLADAISRARRSWHGHASRDRARISEPAVSAIASSPRSDCQQTSKRRQTPIAPVDFERITTKRIVCCCVPRQACRVHQRLIVRRCLNFEIRFLCTRLTY